MLAAALLLLLRIAQRAESAKTENASPLDNQVSQLYFSAGDHLNA